MGRVLENVEPKAVLSYFEDLTEIPRCSGEEKQVTDYLIAFAEKHQLEWFRDDHYNMLIKKKASPGHEDRPTIILQGHSDIVCEKNNDTEHDFTKDPINVTIDGDKITAKGTTLGADDGIGVAFALAILADKDAVHPPIEFVCTSDEERGMTGAESFEFERLKGRIFINLDSDDEGVFIVGCAGGPAVRTKMPVKRTQPMEGGLLATLKIGGLKGGHSGEDIHRGRANSIKLLMRLICAVEREAQAFQLVDFYGGLMYNAIPREAKATIYVKESERPLLEKIVADMEGIFKKEYYLTDKEIEASVDFEGESAGKFQPLDPQSADRLINYITLGETGIIRMNMAFKDTVESSVSIGFATTEEDEIIIETLTRSSVESIYMDMYYKIQRLAKAFGAETVLMSNCPEWEYNPDSKIKGVFKKTYREMYDKDPRFLILHAGLECGMFGKNIEGDMDMISAGPDVRDLHTPGEYVTISSIQKFWEFFVEALKNI